MHLLGSKCKQKKTQLNRGPLMYTECPGGSDCIGTLSSALQKNKDQYNFLKRGYDWGWALIYHFLKKQKWHGMCLFYYTIILYNIGVQ